MTSYIGPAARAIQGSDYLVITAGAGMGVDSGLPDFRGNQGFWAAYPPYQRLGLSFVELANPASFADDPALGWGFYGHRANLYRKTVPHEGFAILRRWAAKKKGVFVVTSNVDGQFQAAGFDPEAIYEVHGSIHWLQCSVPCRDDVWPLPPGDVALDEATMRALPPFLTCPRCREVARPNILMFGDGQWIGARSELQEERWRAWARGIDGPVAVVEVGAGTAIPSIRLHGEHLQRHRGVALVRINPRESHGPAGTISLALGGLDGLLAIDGAMT